MIVFGTPVLVLTAALLAQAEADPQAEAPRYEELPRGGNALPPVPGPIFVEAVVRMAYRLPPASDNAGPALGIGFGLMLGRRYALLGNRLELAAALDFGYAHYNKRVQGARTLNGVQEAFEGQQVISENTFGVLHIFNFLFANVRPWVGAGGGLSVGYFESDAPAFRPGASHAYRPYAQIAMGASVPLTTAVYVDLRIDYHLMLNNPLFTPETGASKQVLGDFITGGLAVGSRFP